MIGVGSVSLDTLTAQHLVKYGQSQQIDLTDQLIAPYRSLEASWTFGDGVVVPLDPRRAHSSAYSTYIIRLNSHFCERM
jgi:hypothetical protein